MFQKILASVGIGAAKVDTRLFNDSVVAGGIIEGEVYIYGGDVDQEIDDVYLKLATEYKREVNDSTVREECVMAKYLLQERFTIGAKEEKVIPFSFQLPYDIPLTLGNSSASPVYIRTGLDIKTAINPRDRDNLQVHPHPLTQSVLDALQNLGFSLYKEEREHAARFRGAYPFVQTLEFRPNGKYRSYLDELEVIFRLRENELEVLLEIDKKARGLGGFFQEALDIDERYVRFFVKQWDLDGGNVEAMIDEIIQSHVS